MNKKLLSGIAVVAAVLALAVLRNVDLARQTELVASLLTVAAIVFGILGVCGGIAIVNFAFRL